MQFIDLALIHIRSGTGGSGCTSFRREKFIEFGGPDGGDGGKGGDVVVRAISNLNTLIDFKYKRHYFAKNGRPGMGQNKTGANGEDVILNVPIGTEVLLENKTTINFDEQNFITFRTRENRKIDLTEYYDLIYEYRNDCLIAGIKYNKTYYKDRDLEPTEDFMFSIKLVPLTAFEQKFAN